MFNNHQLTVNHISLSDVSWYDKVSTFVIGEPVTKQTLEKINDLRHQIVADCLVNRMVSADAARSIHQLDALRDEYFPDSI